MRRAFVRCLNQPMLQHPRLQVPAKQAQYPFVAHLLSHSSYQDVVIDAVKKFLQVKIHDPQIAFANIGLRQRHGLVRRAPRAESVTEFRECRLKDRLQYLHQRLLDEAVQHTGNSELALVLPSRFVDFHAPDR